MQHATHILNSTQPTPPRNLGIHPKENKIRTLTLEVPVGGIPAALLTPLLSSFCKQPPPQKGTNLAVLVPKVIGKELANWE